MRLRKVEDLGLGRNLRYLAMYSSFVRSAKRLTERVKEDCEYLLWLLM